jgi:phospholipase C
VSRIVLPRRDVLKGLAATGFGAGLAACAPEPTTPRKPTPQERGTIDTIVFCMMENRSFDHVFGSLSLLEGRTDVDGLRPEHQNEDFEGNRFGPTPTTTMCAEPDPPHGWSSSRTQFGEGRNDGFVRALLESRGLSAPPSLPMSYLTRAQQPVSYALADGSALCQRWFSSVLTSTWPNRLYLHATQSQGIPGNDLPDGGRYTCRTIWDQLTEAGIEWRYYFTDLPTLALFGRPEWAPNLSVIDQFYLDAAAGNLPPVVCVEPGAGYNDDHPPHHPLLGQMFLGSVYQALAASPHWSRSLFLYTYDEAGGFYDHVPPGRMRDDFADQGFDQLGFRVPAVVTGPYVRNVVDGTDFDHSAVARFLQDHFGIEERLTKRNEAAGDLSVLLDADALAANAPAPPLALPRFTQTEAEVASECRAVRPRTGQPELRALVQATMPHLDLTESLPAIARRSWDRARDLGLWVPRSR